MLRKFTVLIAVGALSATLGTGAIAGGTQQAWDNPGNNQQSSDTGTASRGSFMSMIDGHMSTLKGKHLGSAVSAQSIDRQIELLPGTKSINVAHGETVLIKVSGKAFAWKFDTIGTPAFGLQEIAPKDINVQGVQVYVGKNPNDVGS